MRIDTAPDAVILVGGMGTRLRPLTLSMPKPMLPTAGVPFLTHLLSRIKDAGLSHVVLGTSFKAEVFEQHFGTGEEFGLEIEYVTEDEPLGTGGAIRNVLPHLRADTVVVFNGDVLGDTDVRAVLQTHVEPDADVTLHLVRVSDPRPFGCVQTDLSGRVTAFLEKTQDPPIDRINAGCYVFQREWIEKIPSDRPVSVERAVVFDGARVEAGAVIERSILGYDCRIGPRAIVRDSVVGNGADVGARCELLRGARVWPDVTLPDGGVRFSTNV